VAVCRLLCLADYKTLKLNCGERYLSDNNDNWFPEAPELALPSLSEADCIDMIVRIADLIVVDFPEEIFCVRLVLPDRKIWDYDFYEHVRLNCPGAVPALRN
jgi:hypothetical protein